VGLDCSGDCRKGLGPPSLLGGQQRDFPILNATTTCNIPTSGVTAQSLENLLRNQTCAGWIVIPSWNLRERGSVQDILDGKRRAIVPHIRNDEDFPLRVFVKCADCGQPLTGSWNNGRNKYYPNYRCRNKRCRAVNIRKEALERKFLHLLHRLTPSVGTPLPTFQQGRAAHGLRIRSRHQSARH
jgi:hypothetical protein